MNARVRHRRARRRERAFRKWFTGGRRSTALGVVRSVAWFQAESLPRRPIDVERYIVAAHRTFALLYQGVGP